MHTPGAQATLCNLKAAPGSEQDVAHRHAYVLEMHLHMAMRCIVVSHDMQGAHDADTRRIGRDEHHALLRMLGRIGV